MLYSCPNQRRQADYPDVTQNRVAALTLGQDFSFKPQGWLPPHFFFPNPHQFDHLAGGVVCRIQESPPRSLLAGPAMARRGQLSPPFPGPAPPQRQ